MSVDIGRVNAVLLGLTNADDLEPAERDEVTRELVRRGWVADESAGRFDHTAPGLPYWPKPDEPQCLGDSRFTRLPVDLSLLEVCARCQVQDWCVQVTRPAEHFSGVCGGKVWSDGRVVT